MSHYELIHHSILLSYLSYNFEKKNKQKSSANGLFIKNMLENEKLQNFIFRNCTTNDPTTVQYLNNFFSLDVFENEIQFLIIINKF